MNWLASWIAKHDQMKEAILARLGSDDVSGRELRETLNASGSSIGRAAFYRLMAEMEQAGQVVGFNQEKTVEGEVIHERRYVVKRK